MPKEQSFEMRVSFADTILLFSYNKLAGLIETEAMQYQWTDPNA